MTAPPLLRAESLRRSYGDRLVVDVPSLAVSRGEVLAVLGPNGAGKSTLFRLLMLLERPDRGRILLDGEPATAGDPATRRRLAGVFQRPYLFAGDVDDNLRFGLRAVGVPRSSWDERVRRAARELGLERVLHADVARLSGGEIQRVALARALVLEPDVLFLDEPTANLDATIRRRFREELESVIRERAGAVVLITHDAADAFDLADRVAVLENGRVVQVGTPEDLTVDPATPFIAAFTGAELLLDGVVEAAGGGAVEVRTGGTVLVARAPDPPPSPGTPVHIRYRPEDVTLSADDPAGVSARNHLRMRVRDVRPTAGLIRVRLDGQFSLAAVVTRASAERLRLAPGREVTALLKTDLLGEDAPGFGRRNDHWDL
ncbi:MAG TPA: ABC transporter ATP-binding protein, partial [Longimicrobiales bacterium]|nr:ABC transporter ATP-binding protein [Longimicrobiales bacterium]